MKNSRASRALRQALHPSQLVFTSFAQHLCVGQQKHSTFSFWAPLHKKLAMGLKCKIGTGPVWEDDS